MKLKLPQLPSGAERYQLLIWPLVGIGISILLLVLVIIPQLLRIWATNQKIETTKDKITTLNQKYDQLKRIDLNEYKQNLNEALIALPLDKDIPSGISQIQTVALNDQIQISGLIVGSGTTTSNPASYQFKIEGVGSLDSVKKFIADIQKGPRVMSLDSVELSSGNKEGSVYSVNLGITTYSQVQETKLGPLDQPVVNLNDKEIAVLTAIKQSTQNTQIISQNGTTGAKGKSDPFQ
ncbi:type 4a pilus biogenesis protein PilO [Candidatus Daviesbacteria bacterium]|nr:type 4a pilus biogenesis protein PilO [Candidatus Daviesbacteria bacterium]